MQPLPQASVTLFRLFTLLALLLVLHLCPAQPHLQAAPPAERTGIGDLVIATVLYQPLNPGAGTTNDIMITVKNQGDATIEDGFNLYLYVEASQAPTQTTPYTSRFGYALSLPPGATFVYTRTGQPFTQNNPKVYVWVDPPWENKVVESNENNNLFPEAINPSIDGYENDDSCTGVQEIVANGAEQLRNLTPNAGRTVDEDLIKFTVVSGITYYGQAIAIGADADLSLQIGATCPVAPGLGSGAKFEFTASTTGTYYMSIKHNQANGYGPDTRYRLVLTSNDNCQDAFEPNNSCQLAGDLPFGAPQSHGYCKLGDVDWSKFPVVAGARYKVETANVGAKADTQTDLYLSCTDVTNTASGESFEITASQAGFVYIKTQHKNPNFNGSGADYTVKATLLSGAGCPEDPFEQDDHQGEAKEIPVTAPPQTHNICPAADEDWLKFVAVKDVTYTIETFNLGSASDTLLCLYTANGDKLACDDDGGPGKGSRLTWQAATAGSFFVQIKDQHPEVAGANTQYDLQILPSLCTADSYEDDNATGTAKPIPADGSVQNHNFCPSSDEDWSKFTAAPNTTYTIETIVTDAKADTVVELYNEAGVRLGGNDDYAPGVASQVSFTSDRPGAYYIKVRPYNPARYGRGTEYALRVRAGTVTPTPTTTITPPPTPTTTPTPQPSTIRTLILVNRSRLVSLYSEGEVSQLMAKLETLVQHPEVQGEIIRLDNHSQVSNVYAAWVADQTSVEKANLVTAAIRAVILGIRQQRAGIEYVVLVGDDRALPFRRIADNTDRSPERTYKSVSKDHPTGAALSANYYLTDDYYVDQQPDTSQGHELYIPDLAVGRLIESPGEMSIQIDAFLTKPETTAENVLVTGYDFVQDAAARDCEEWKKDAGSSKVDCTLIGDGWSNQNLRDLQLRTSAPFMVQSISGHATHYSEEAPDRKPLQGAEIAAAPVSWVGGVIYTPGCHAGLNVPPTNSIGPIDLAQAFVSKGAVYIGNTGYGWGLRRSIGLSEKVIRLFSQELLRGTATSMGKALVSAKKQYFQQAANLNAFDEKVMQELVFYGLPMRKMLTTAALSDPEPTFPGVTVDLHLPLASLGDTQVVTGKLAIDVAGTLGSVVGYQLVGSSDGDYIALDGVVSGEPGQPVQPQHYYDVSVQQQKVRSALVMNATFTVKENFAPLVASPYNEYFTNTVAIAQSLSDPLAWYPAQLTNTRSDGYTSSLVSTLGQYNPANRQLRLYEQLDTELYYSTSTDQTAPDVTVIDGLFHKDSGTIAVKVDAEDSSGIQRVVVSYLDAVTSANTRIHSVDLTFNADAHKWIGAFPAGETTQFFIQVVDKAGNMRTDTNKGRYYSAGKANESFSGCNRTNQRCLYLPFIVR